VFVSGPNDALADLRESASRRIPKSLRPVPSGGRRASTRPTRASEVESREPTSSGSARSGRWPAKFGASTHARPTPPEQFGCSTWTSRRGFGTVSTAGSIRRRRATLDAPTRPRRGALADDDVSALEVGGASPSTAMRRARCGRASAASSSEIPTSSS